MVLLKTSEEWQRQSSLLLLARPATARITTKYTIPNLDSPKYTKTKKRKRDAAEADGAASAAKVPKAWLTLKTYDPESGVVLKFKTDRAAEVGRLINGLGRLGTHMAALPQKTEDAVMEDVPAAEDTAPSASTPASATTAPPDGKAQQGSGGGGSGGGGKKKKKGKK